MYHVTLQCVQVRETRLLAFSNFTVWSIWVWDRVYSETKKSFRLRQSCAIIEEQGELPTSNSYANDTVITDKPVSSHAKRKYLHFTPQHGMLGCAVTYFLSAVKCRYRFYATKVSEGLPIFPWPFRKIIEYYTADLFRVLVEKGLKIKISWDHTWNTNLSEHSKWRLTFSVWVWSWFEA